MTTTTTGGGSLLNDLLMQKANNPETPQHQEATKNNDLVAPSSSLPSSSSLSGVTNNNNKVQTSRDQSYGSSASQGLAEALEEAGLSATSMTTTTANSNTAATNQFPPPVALSRSSSSSSTPASSSLPASKKQFGTNKKACYHAMVAGNTDYILQKLLRFVPLNQSVVAAPASKVGSSSSSSGFGFGNENVVVAAAGDWKVILDTPTAAWTNSSVRVGHTVCDPSEFVRRDAGGPKGIAHNLLVKTWKRKQKQFQKQQPQKPTTTTTTTKPVYNVVLMGDSHLREIWDGWVCIWSNDITNITITKQDHLLLAAAPNNDVIDGEGQNETNETHTNSSGGGGGGNKTTGKPLTQQLSNPTPNNEDDGTAAMVEFGGKIRFYYIYQPYRQPANLPSVSASLGLDLETVDQLIFSQAGIQENHNILQKLNFVSWLPKGVWNNQIQWNPTTFWQQKKSMINEGVRRMASTTNSSVSVHDQYDNEDINNHLGGTQDDRIIDTTAGDVAYSNNRNNNTVETVCGGGSASSTSSSSSSQEAQDEGNFLLLMLWKHATVQIHGSSKSSNSGVLLDSQRLPATSNRNFFGGRL